MLFHSFIQLSKESIGLNWTKLISPNCHKHTMMLKVVNDSTMKNEKYVSLVKYVDANPHHQIIMGRLTIDVVDY